MEVSSGADEALASGVAVDEASEGCETVCVVCGAVGVASVEGTVGAACAGSTAVPTPSVVESSVAMKMRRRVCWRVEGYTRCMRSKPICREKLRCQLGAHLCVGLMDSCEFTEPAEHLLLRQPEFIGFKNVSKA